MTRQALVWVPTKDFQVSGRFIIPLGPLASPRPDRVWTLSARTESEPPELPFVPIHLHGAFLEDYLHDWKISGGSLFYGSRLRADGQVWLLLEWEEKA